MTKKKAEVKLTTFEHQAIEQVRERMGKYNLTITEISQRTGWPMPMVSRILNGKQRASFNTWEKIYQAVDKP